MNTFFISDTHASHKNIILGTSDWPDKSKCRKFNTLDDHNNLLLNNINKIIDKNDTIYHLGDFAFSGIQCIIDFRNKINCNNIHLVLGNHDQNMFKEHNGIKINTLFSSVTNYKEISLNKQKFVLFHYPIASWNSMSRSIHLHGHTHRSPQEKFKNGGKSMDVGVDGNNYMPYSLEEIMEIMKDREVLREGHH